MSVGYEAFKKLQALKLQEIEDYYTCHAEIIKPFLSLQNEYKELGSRATNALLNAGHEIMRTHKPRQYTQSELAEQLRMMEEIAGKKKHK